MAPSVEPGELSKLFTEAEIVAFVSVKFVALTVTLPPGPCVRTGPKRTARSVTEFAGEANPLMVMTAAPVATSVPLLEISAPLVRVSVPTFAVMLAGVAAAAPVAAETLAPLSIVMLEAVTLILPLLPLASLLVNNPVPGPARDKAPVHPR